MLVLEPIETPASSWPRLLERLPSLPSGAKVLVVPAWLEPGGVVEQWIPSLAALRGVIGHLLALGARVTVGHSRPLLPPDARPMPWAAFASLVGADTLQAEFPQVTFADLSLAPREAHTAMTPEGVGLEVLLPAGIADYDLRVVCSTLRMDVATGIAGGARALMGLLPESEQLRFHRDGLDACVALLAKAVGALGPLWALSDAETVGEGEAPLAGVRSPFGLCFGGDDLLEVDTAAALLMGLDPGRVPHVVELARLLDRELPSLPPEGFRMARSLRRPEPVVKLVGKVRIWPGDACRVCLSSRQTVEGFFREGPLSGRVTGRLQEGAALLRLAWLQGLDVMAGHQPLSRMPPNDRPVLAIGDCAKRYAEHFSLPHVGGCPLGGAQSRPALMEALVMLGEKKR